MSKLRIPSTHATKHVLMMMAIAAMTALGCAPDDSTDDAKQETISKDPHAVHVAVDPDADVDADDHASDKGLRRDWCCVEKFNMEVEECFDIKNRTKLVAGSTCWANEWGTSFTVRDGLCNQYQDCVALNFR